MGRESPIAISGIGIIAPLGYGVTQACSCLEQNQAQPGHLQCPGPAPLPGYSWPSFEADEFFPPRVLRRLSADLLLALTTAALALKDAHLTGEKYDPCQIGVVVGTHLGALQETENFLQQFFGEGPASASPIAFMHSVHNIFAATISQQFGLQGPNLTFSGRGLSFEMALWQALAFLRQGQARWMLVGAFEHWSYFAVRVYQELGLLVRTADCGISRPFDLSTLSTYPGEGGAILVLESLEQARCRGATVYGVLSRVGFSHSRQQRPLQFLQTLLPTAQAPELLLLPANGNPRWDRSLWHLARTCQWPFASYQAYFGASALSGALQLIVGLITLQKQCLFSPLWPGAEHVAYSQAGGLLTNQSRPVNRVLHYNRNQDGQQVACLLTSPYGSIPACSHPDG